MSPNVSMLPPSKLDFSSRFRVRLESDDFVPVYETVEHHEGRLSSSKRRATTFFLLKSTTRHGIVLGFAEVSFGRCFHPLALFLNWKAARRD